MVRISHQAEPFFLFAGAGAAVAAALMSYVLTPTVQRAALRYGAAREPRARDVHTHPIARWGGVAIYLAFVFAVCLSLAFAHWVLGREILWRTIKAGFGVFVGGTL